MTFKTVINVDQLRELLNEPQVVTVDCRFDLMHPQAGAQAYLQGHLPKARYLDLNQDLSGTVGANTGRHPLPNPEVFAGLLGRLGIDNSTQIVAYDENNGSFAARLWWMLRWLGHDTVAVLDGGLKAWTARGGALDSQEVPIQATQFFPRIEAGAVLSTAEIENLVGNLQIVLTDARSPERYAGSVEPIDSVAGHIPGAVNHPFTTNLDADGHFLPAQTLKAQWQERLAGKDASKLVAMCGSGVTACHNLLSLELAGLPGGKLYAGSWSEWIRDSRRPIARG